MQRQFQLGLIEPKKPIFPRIRVGDVVQVTARVNEWSRRNHMVVRELIATSRLEDGSKAIEIVDPEQEIIHWQHVQQLHTQVYPRIFRVPAYEPIKPLVKPRQEGRDESPHPSSLFPSEADYVVRPRKRARVEQGPPSEASTMATSSMPGSEASHDPRSRRETLCSGPKLRHPFKLDRKHLSVHTFTRYMTYYMERMTNEAWTPSLSHSSHDSSIVDYDHSLWLDYCAKYLPELTWPPKTIVDALERKRRDIDIALGRNPLDNDSTPKASRLYSHPKHGPVTPSTRRDENGRINLTEPVSQRSLSGACTMDHLIHATFLRDIGERVLKQEYRKRKEAEKINLMALTTMSSSSSSRRRNGKQDAEARAEARRFQLAERARFKANRHKMMARLFEQALRSKMLDEGSIVEVELLKEDVEEQAHEREVRRMERQKVRKRQAKEESTLWTVGGGTTVLSDKTNEDHNDQSTIAFDSPPIGACTKVNLAERLFPRPREFPVPDYDAEGCCSDGSEDDTQSQSANDDWPTTPRAGQPRLVKKRPADTVGYLPLTAHVIAFAILHVLHLDAWTLSRRHIPLHDPRRQNGLSTHDVTNQIGHLHYRWEKVAVDVVDAGLEQLEALGQVEKFGNGWKVTRMRKVE